LRWAELPVREALKVLESEAFVESRPHRGAFISVVTREDIRKIYEVRSLIEAEIVRRATPFIPGSVLDELEAHLDEVHESPEDRGKHVDADIFLHEKLSEHTGNELLTEILDGLNNRILRVRRFGQLQPGYHLMRSHREHYAILKAIKQREPEQAALIMSSHLMRSAERIERAVDTS